MTRTQKYRPSVDIPAFVREYKTFSPTDIAKVILDKRNKAVSPESITMWLKRNPDIESQLKIDVVETNKTNQIVESTIFNNGVFEELPSVKTWILDMHSRDVKVLGMQSRIGYVKRVCQTGFESMRHPDRLTLQDCQEFLAKQREAGLTLAQTKGWRIALRDFLSSKGIVVKGKISGKKGAIGEYSTLYYPDEQIQNVIEKVDQINHEVALVDTFMYANATRIEASLHAKWSKVQVGSKIATVTILDKKDLTWTKVIPLTLLEELKKIRIENCDLLFPNVTKKLCCAINRNVIKSMLDVPASFNNFNHFFRHIYAQKMLRKTEWNYDVVASLGGWLDTATLKRCYGEPPPDVISQWLEKYGAA